MISSARALRMAARPLQAAEDGPLELESIVMALAAQFDVTTGGRQVVRRRRLDTFDRRLSAAGLMLEHRRTTARGAATRGAAASESGERLVLNRPDGSSPIAVSAGDLRWPALVDALPPGRVRDTIAPVVGVRALMVVSDERRGMRRLELRNHDGKTVARVDLDEPASPGAVPLEPARVTVRRLRGYDEQASRAGRLLVGLGLRVVDRDGGREGSSSLPPPPRADRSLPAQVLLSTALSGFRTAMVENLPGLLNDVDTEFLHDFRVAVRRTRTTLKLAGPALPAVMRNRWEPAFKSLGDLTTPVRDLDVYTLDLPAMRGWLVTAEPADLNPLGAHLRSRRAAARRALVRSLRSAAYRQQIVEWGDELAALAAAPRGTPSSEGSDHEQLSAGGLAERSISRAYRRVVRGGAVIRDDSPAGDLHDLRKRCKELRYALEIFAPVTDRAARKRAVADLKGLQDVLGRFQDTEVQRRALRGFAEEMMAQGTTAGAMLAMGELIAHLDVEQDRARRDFDVAFARFARPSSLHLVHPQGGGR